MQGLNRLGQSRRLFADNDVIHTVSSCSTSITWNRGAHYHVARPHQGLGGDTPIPTGGLPARPALLPFLSYIPGLSLSANHERRSNSRSVGVGLGSKFAGSAVCSTLQPDHSRKA